MDRRDLLKYLGLGSLGEIVPLAIPIFRKADKSNQGPGMTDLTETSLDWPFRPGELVLLGGRPSMGKTQFAIDRTIDFAGRLKRPVAYFSLELSKEQLVERMLCARSKIEGARFRSDCIRDEELPVLTDAARTLSEMPIFIDDTPGLHISELVEKCRRLRQQKLGLVIVDDLQLMRATGRNENRVGEILEISRGLKALAKDFNIPVLALSQLKRSLEARQDKVPRVSDVRHLDVIDPDTILFVYREDYYRSGISLGQDVEIIVGRRKFASSGMKGRFYES